MFILRLACLLVCCLDCIGHNTYYFVSAGFLYLMQLKSKGGIKKELIDHTFGKGIDFGWRFLRFSLKLYYKEYLDSGGRHTKGMHNRYDYKPCFNDDDSKDGMCR